MDLPEPDYRLLPALESAEEWVAIEAASAPPRGPIELLASSDLTAPLLAGISVPLGDWQEERVWLYDEAGRVCEGSLDRGAVAVSVQYADGRAPWLARCSGIDQCPDVAARHAWDAGTHPLLVAHVQRGTCPIPHGGIVWAQRAERSVSPSPPIFAVPVADEHLVNLAVASFRRLAGWRTVQDRWLLAVDALDATEWDTTGGTSPEVARFSTPEGRTLVAVTATVGAGCEGDFSATFSAAFMQRQDRTLSQFRPSSLAPDASFPGFAPLVLNRLEPSSFAARARSGGPGGKSLDARAERIGTCTNPTVSKARR